MVGRKVLDGLRKGKKDVYALNVQYVKRYSKPFLPRDLLRLAAFYLLRSTVTYLGHVLTYV